MSATPPPPAPGSPIVDDKSPLCIPFILERLAIYRKAQEAAAAAADADAAAPAADPPRRRPFVVGINGVQGVGKSTLVSTLYETLQQQHGLETLVVSIDDFYLPHAAQRALAAAHPDNPLVQVRGEPGTHDTALLAAFMDALVAGAVAHVPAYDKAAFGGQGDRIAPTPADPGRVVNGPGQRPVEVVVVEGWCVGFRAISPDTIKEKWLEDQRRISWFNYTQSIASGITIDPPLTLAPHALENLLFINAQLPAYDAALTRHLDAFIHLDTEDIRNVYVWRRQQEAALRLARGPGAGMTDEQVTRFVDAYYPAYLLFLDGVRHGVFLEPRQDSKDDDKDDGTADVHDGQPGLVADFTRRIGVILGLCQDSKDDGKDDGTADVHGRQLRIVVNHKRRIIESQTI